MLRLITLIERCTRGQVVVGGHNLSRMRARHIPRYRRHLGVVFQDHRLLAERTVFDNVALPLVAAGYRHGDVRRRVRAALDLVGLLDKERLQPRVLSSGEQQRVGIARAVVHRPSLLLADEPTGNLDPRLSRYTMALFERFNQIGGAVVIATHDLECAASCDRIAMLSAGTLAAIGSPGEILRPDALQRTLGVQVRCVPDPHGGPPLLRLLGRQPGYKEHPPA